MQRMEPLEGRTLFASYAATTVPELIAAIHAANASPGADTISLPAGAMLSLSATDNTANGATGLPRITDGAGLTVVGGGTKTTTTTIERSATLATPAFRLFEVAAGGSLTLRNLTLQGGMAGSYLTPQGTAAIAQGGAIYNGGSLALDGVTLRNNTARGAGNYSYWYSPMPGVDGAGGAVFSNGALTVTGSAFMNNVAAGGGGFNATAIRPGPQSGSGAYLVGSSDGGDGYGGALYVAGGTAAVSGSTLTANTASGGNGGNGYSTYTATRDSGDGGDGSGGGVYVGGGSVTLRTVTTTLNVARGGLAGTNPYVSGKRYNGAPGRGIGGGVYLFKGSAGLDDFSVSHLVDNTASTSSPNIAGSYQLLH
jgi:hypothetical protein